MTDVRDLAVVEIPPPATRWRPLPDQQRRISCLAEDANAAFALTSFLYGGNAAYIEDLYARYEADPAAVDADWRTFFQSLKDDAGDVTRTRAGRHGNGRTGRCRRATSSSPRWSATGPGSRRASASKIKAKAQAKGVEALGRRRAAGDARFGRAP